jgi:uncharacterized protein (TIGR02466 family)
MSIVPGMESKYQLEQVFWTPVVVARLARAATINGALESVIQQRRLGEAGVQRSNVQGWHSDTKLTEWAADAIRPVLDEVSMLADEHTFDAQAPDGRCGAWKIEAWANVSGCGAYNVPHYHPGHYWSAIYYVRIDEGAGGELVLFDPRLPVINMVAPRLSFRHNGGERSIVLRPEAGMLILFPAWLQHSVTPWEGDGERISIAMNLRPR